MKRSVIVVGDYNREDFSSIGDLLCDRFEVYFLEYLDESHVWGNAYKKWGKAVYWKDYKSAHDLLDALDPAFVIFYFIESLNHVALNVSCRHKGVRTFHLEHGIRHYEIQKSINAMPAPGVPVSLTERLKKIKTLPARIRGRLFYLNTIKKLPPPMAAFLREYFSCRSTHNIFETFQQIKSPLRVADRYISFSPRIFEFHKVSDHLPPDHPVSFIGCPQFDDLAGLEGRADAQDMLFIDNPFEAQGLFGWDDDYKSRFLSALVQLCGRLKRKLWIKVHPYSRQSLFEGIVDGASVCLVESPEQFKDAIRSSSIILGFYSTLLMPLMALPHTTCYSFEMHPGPPGFALSAFLTETGAITEVRSWHALEQYIETNDVIHNSQATHKLGFINSWLYRFDGHSRERLKNILLGEVS